MSRVTITIPDELVADIDRVSSSLGYSRSALVVYFLGGPIHQIAGEFGLLDLPVDDIVRKRFVGDRSLKELDELMLQMGTQSSGGLSYGENVD